MHTDQYRDITQNERLRRLQVAYHVLHLMLNETKKETGIILSIQFMYTETGRNHIELVLNGRKNVTQESIASACFWGLGS